MNHTLRGEHRVHSCRQSGAWPSRTRLYATDRETKRVVYWRSRKVLGLPREDQGSYY